MPFVVMMDEMKNDLPIDSHQLPHVFDSLEDAQDEAKRLSETYAQSGRREDKLAWWGRHGDSRLFHFYTLTDAAALDRVMTGGPFERRGLR